MNNTPTIRSQILAAVVARLENVSKEGGYRTNVGNVVKLNPDKDTEALAETETLAAVVRDVGGMELAGMPGENVGVIELTIGILCADRDSLAVDQTARLAHADILRAIGTDKLFGGLCDDTVTGACDYAESQSGKAASTVTQHLRINYRTRRWALNELPA